jgi:signal peptidase I
MFFGPFILYAIIKTFFCSPFLVDGDSMLPTLQSGEFFMVDSLAYRAGEPKRDDIVVFYLDDNPDYYYVKRVIGLPGDRIHLEKDGVFLADPKTGVLHKLAEPFLEPDPHPSEHFLSMTNELGQDFTVPPGGYFVLGDNRENSRDSRFFTNPFVPRNNLVGKFGFEL